MPEIQRADVFYTPTPVGTDLDAAVPTLPTAKDIQVEPEKVLEVARVIESQANALQDVIDQRLQALRLDPPSNDAVSRHATDAWNELVAAGEDSYAKRVRDYVTGLRALVGQLRTASQKYQAGEDEKSASLGDRRVYKS